MTENEAIQFLDNIKHAEAGRAIGKDGFYAELMGYHVEALNMAIKALETIPKYKDAYNKGYDDGAKATYEHLKMCEEEQEPYDFAEWVATEIFDEMWEYNKDAFAEIACRKLAKLGIVRAKGDEWELVEPQESRGEE